jgi:TolB protein
MARLKVLEIDALPTAPRAVGPDQVHELDPGWFPGKHRLVFASTADDAAGQDYDLFSLEADGNGLVRLTFSPGTDRFPALSPDGRQIAWVSERNFAATGDQDLFVADWAE